MKILSQLVLGLICAGICAGQERTSAGAAEAGEAKNIVQGKVVQEPGGLGIRKVKVDLMEGSLRRQHYEVVTDETGQFNALDVKPGTYLVELRRSGYVVSGKANQRITIKVIAGQNTKGLVFHMLAAGVITGKIVDLDGDPLGSVGVTATAGTGRTNPRNPRHGGSAVTNDLGEYRIADLPPGSYIVQAAPPENSAARPTPNEKVASNDRLIYVPTYFPGTLDERQAAPVVVPAGATAFANFGVQANHAYRVSGTVTGPKGRPMPPSGASEAVMEAMGRSMGRIILVGTNERGNEQELDEEGRFDFPNVLPGTYRALILLTGFFGGEEPSMKMHAVRTPIEVNGSDLRGLQLQVDAGSDVSGKFRMEGNEKIDWSKLNVMLIPTREIELDLMTATMPGGNATLTEDGSFEIKDVPEGNFHLAVVARSDNYRDYYEKSVLVGGREVADTGFSPTSGAFLDVIVSSKGAGIEGTVVDRNGKAFADAIAVAVPSSGRIERPDAYQADRTDEKGHFLLRGMNPGEFLVLAFEEMEENYQTAEFFKKYERKGEKVSLEEGVKKSVVLKLITEEDKER